MKRVIISGGGTGGHIFPAIAIANALMRLEPKTKILFVGAKDRMEMDMVPAAGYEIVGLDIRGFQRRQLLKNLSLPFLFVKSYIQARGIINKFKPHVAVGVGGYASAPILYAASKMGIPYLIQEPNSYAGIANKILAKHACQICVAFEGMQPVFPSKKLILTGNPVRKESVDIAGKREEAMATFALSPQKKTVLVIGGSQGAGSLNQSIALGLEKFYHAGVQVIWQTGKSSYKKMVEKFGSQPKDLGIRVVEFLNRMDLAYAAADVVISRAGAGAIAELCMVKKPAIFVPSPYVAEDHQTKNARALVEKQAAILVADSQAEKSLVNLTLELVDDTERCKLLSAQIGNMAQPYADENIAKKVLDIAIN